MQGLGFRGFSTHTRACLGEVPGKRARLRAHWPMDGHISPMQTLTKPLPGEYKHIFLGSSTSLLEGVLRSRVSALTLGQSRRRMWS